MHHDAHRTPPLMNLLLTILACQGAPVDSAGPPAWSELEAAAPQINAFTRDYALDDGSATTRHRHARRAALSFLIQPEADRVVVLDELSRVSMQSHCLDPEDLGVAPEPAWQGRCGRGEVEVQRGALSMEGVVDVALDEDGLVAWLVSSDGRARRVELDPRVDGSLGWLRSGVELRTGLRTESAVYAEGALWLAQADGVTPIDEEGLPGPSRPFDGPTLLSGDGGLWVADAEGLHGPGLEAPLPSDVLPAAAGGLGVTWFDGAVVWSDGRTVPFAEAPTSLAIDPRSGAAWVLTEGALSRISPDGDLDTIGSSANLISTTWTHDVLQTEGDGYQVAFDERALDAALPPLYLTSVTFVESPSKRSERIVCDAPQLDDSLSLLLDRLDANLPLLETLPGAVAIGVTPRFAEAVFHCAAEERLAGLRGGGWEIGLFPHDASGCASLDCFTAFLGERRGRLRAVGLDPSWMCGASSEDDLDPIAASVAVGLDRRLFFGHGLMPEVAVEDPLYKQPWPLIPGDEAPAVAASTQSALPEGDPAGAQALYTGNTVRGFAAGSCVGLLARECILLSQGSDRFGPEDVEALTLLAMHAAARRTEAVSAWSWHWPDLTQTDYAEGCEVDEAGVWTGDEGCQAVELQRLTWDLHQRLVLRGVGVWSTPSELPWP